MHIQLFHQAYDTCTFNQGMSSTEASVVTVDPPVAVLI